MFKLVRSFYGGHSVDIPGRRASLKTYTDSLDVLLVSFIMCIIFIKESRSMDSENDETVAAFARNLADYVASTRLDAVTVLLHGGEPLLAGEERIIRFCGTVRNALEPLGTSVEFAMQTNGVLLSPRWMEVLGSLGIT